MFPKFLDHEQNDFLIKLAAKQIESSQFKIMLKSLKAKQKKIKEEEDNEFRNTKTTSFNATNTSNFLFSQVNTNNCKKISFSNDTMTHFSKVFQKYDNLMKNNYEERFEELNIQTIVDNLKSKLKNKEIVENKESKIEKYFNENKKHKEYFEEILLLRSKIEETEELCRTMKEEMLRKYKQKFEMNKIISKKNSMTMDLIHSALFGNNIII